jgi:hypothetical protein
MPVCDRARSWICRTSERLSFLLCKTGSDGSSNHPEPGKLHLCGCPKESESSGREESIGRVHYPATKTHAPSNYRVSTVFLLRELYIRPVSIGKPNLDCLGNRRHAGEKSKESTVRRQNIGKMGIQSYNRQPRPLRSCYSNRNPHTPGHPISKPPVFMPPIQTPTIPSH